MMCGWALVGAALVWLMYVALEPHVRKRWPTSLVSWSRVLGGEITGSGGGARRVAGRGAGGVLGGASANVGNLLPGWMGKMPTAPDSSWTSLFWAGFITPSATFC